MSSVLHKLVSIQIMSPLPEASSPSLSIVVQPTRLDLIGNAVETSCSHTKGITRDLMIAEAFASTSFAVYSLPAALQTHFVSSLLLLPSFSSHPTLFPSSSVNRTKRSAELQSLTRASL